MIANGRTVLLKESFTAQLATIQEYISQYNAIRGRKLITSIVNYVLDVIAPSPLTLPEYNVRVTPGKFIEEPYLNVNTALSIK